jgi:hypothetical protein
MMLLALFFLAQGTATCERHHQALLVALFVVTEFAFNVKLTVSPTIYAATL